MTDKNFRVEVVGHATLRVQCGGRTLLTDPWLVDPIGCGSGFHFPPLVHTPQELAVATDAIYISHIHPDHFHPPTLALFPKHIPIFIGTYQPKEFRDQVRALGFPVIEVPFATPTKIAGTDFEITLIEHDYQESAAYDSALVVRTPEFSLFENNDCFLNLAKYQWVREHFDIDYAFLGYSPASFFPICFEMDEGEKQRLLREAAERRYKDFTDAARALQPRRAFPFASDARFFLAGALWKNVAFNSAAEALRRLTDIGIAGDILGPGDRILADDRIARVCAVARNDTEVEAIARHAMSVQDWVAGMQRELPLVRPDLVARFRDYILRLRRETRDKLPEVARYVIAYRLLGEEPAEFYFDFSQPDENVFQKGKPARYDMRYSYLANGLQLVLDGEMDWDVLHFTDEVSVHQLTYAREFYMMLRSEMLDLG